MITEFNKIDYLVLIIALVSQLFITLVLYEYRTTKSMFDKKYESIRNMTIIYFHDDSFEKY